MTKADRFNTFSAANPLQEVDTAVYSWIRKHRALDRSAIADDLSIPEQEAADSLQRLLAARLVHIDPADPTAGFAVAPETAAAQLADPIEARIREERQHVAWIREELNRFTPLYHRGQPSNSQFIEVLGSLQEVRDAISRAAAGCTQEMLTCQPGGGARVPEAMEEAIGRDQEMLGRGIRIRTLYHHTARFNGPSQAYVAAASALGARYRTAHELFGRLIVFDREIAFIPVMDDSWGAVVLREPNAVAYLCTVFEQTWDRATPFTDAASQGLEQVSNEIQETIVRLLASGLKDETIARRLGMSLRTARRHIADIMEQLEAGSRFQAGVAAATGGLLHPLGPPANQPANPCPDPLPGKASL